MSRNLNSVLPQSSYAALHKLGGQIRKEFEARLEPTDLNKIRAYRDRGEVIFQKSDGGTGFIPIGDPHSATHTNDSKRGTPRWDAAVKMLSHQVEKLDYRLGDGLKKAGVTTSLGFNFFDLRGPAYMLFPVLTPFRNSIARVGRQNDGFGTAANWKGSRNVGTAYLGVSEGNRAPVAVPNEANYIATYKDIGTERAVTFDAQHAGEGYTDNVADEHLRGAFETWLGEEGMDLFGNPGNAAGQNGFQLGTANTPVTVLVGTAGNIPNTTSVSFRVIEITAMGYPVNNQFGYFGDGLTGHTVAGGLIPSYVRTNADGSQDTIFGGIGAVSAASNVITTGSGSSNKATVSVTPKNGAFAWAWFVNVTDASAPTKANSLLTAITTAPTYTYNLAAPAGTQTAAATGLSTDNSAQPLDYSGLTTYSAATSGALWNNMAGTTLTPGSSGSVVQIDTDLQYYWTNFQAVPTAIWVDATAKIAIDAAVLSSDPNPTAFRFQYTRDAQGNLLGGFSVTAYFSKFSASINGGVAIPIRVHPMMPAGTIMYDLPENPYPHSRAPFMRAMLTRRDYYSIEWPVVSRNWTFGTYAEQVLAHVMPWITGVRTGIVTS